MKNLFSLFIVMIAIFALCSCSPKSYETEYIDPSSKVNWHDAPFDKCDANGELVGVEKAYRRYDFGEFYDNAEDYSVSYAATVSASIDGGFFYALKCYEKVGWCLSIYKKVEEENATRHSYKFLNGCYYNLEEKPLASYQLTIRPANNFDCFACKGDDGKVYISTPIEIIKAVNIIKDSSYPEEDVALKGFFYYVSRSSEVIAHDRNFIATQVFTYRGKDSTSLEPQYVYTQINYGTDSFDSSFEGWNKNTLSSLVGYFANGIYLIPWYSETDGPSGDYKPFYVL